MQPGKDVSRVHASTSKCHIDDDDNLATELADIQYERIEAGKYVVVGELLINGKLQTRRIECRNPAYGWAKLEQEVEVILIAQLRAEADADRKRARRKSKLDRDDD